MSREKPKVLLNIMDRVYIDSLTSAYNRKFFNDHLKKALVKAMEENLIYSLLLLDFDDFDHFNKMNGFDSGDQVLQQFGYLMKRHLREGDFIVRYTDAQFLIVLVEADKETGFAVAERLRKLIEMHQFPGEQIQPDGKLTVSIGLATFPDDGESIEFLIKRADTALYKAKKRMKNRVEVFNL
ncbi:MAG: GGDEF domain-containing protein [Halanaerobiales bacterium]|nr:GGDEF domain-containing protein [Halanaerobiales bacterium]